MKVNLGKKFRNAIVEATIVGTKKLQGKEYIEVKVDSVVEDISEIAQFIVGHTVIIDNRQIL